MRIHVPQLTSLHEAITLAGGEEALLKLVNRELQVAARLAEHRRRQLPPDTYTARIISTERAGPRRIRVTLQVDPPPNRQLTMYEYCVQHAGPIDEEIVKHPAAADSRAAAFRFNTDLLRKEFWSTGRAAWVRLGRISRFAQPNVRVMVLYEDTWAEPVE